MFSNTQKTGDNQSVFNIIELTFNRIGNVFKRFSSPICINLWICNLKGSYFVISSIFTGYTYFGGTLAMHKIL